MDGNPVESSAKPTDVTASRSAGTPHDSGQSLARQLEQDLQSPTSRPSAEALVPRDLDKAFQSAEGEPARSSDGMERLIRRIRSLLECTLGHELKKSQDREAQARYDRGLVVAQCRNLENRIQHLETRLRTKEEQLAAANDSRACLSVQLDASIERCREDRVESAKRRRLDREVELSARLRAFDQLAIENQKLKKQLEIAAGTSPNLTGGLARHLLSVSKKQVAEEISAYTQDQARQCRYLMRFVEAYPSFAYWSDEEGGETEDQGNPALPKATDGVEVTAAASTPPETAE